MTQKVFIRRDTNAWTFQVWVSFGIAVFLCAVGIINMPSENLDRAFLALGYFFCLSSAFVLSKTVRDNQAERVDTGAWVMQVWIAFAVALVLTAWGLVRMNIGPWEKSYMGATWLYLISSAFTLQKAIRDKHEADLLDIHSGDPLADPARATPGAE
jgi:hypothetical protein